MLEQPLCRFYSSTLCEHIGKSFEFDTLRNDTLRKQLDNGENKINVLFLL